MHEPRGGLCVVSSEGKLWAIGGYNLTSGSLSSIEVYDPQSNKWTFLQKSMKSVRGTIVGCSYSFQDFDEN